MEEAFEIDYTGGPVCGGDQTGPIRGKDENDKYFFDEI